MAEVDKSKFDEKTLKRSEFCESKCPTCVKGREKGSGIWYMLVKLEDRLHFCPWCRAYQKVYGVPAYEKPKT
jgi:ribosomal protein S27E